MLRKLLSVVSVALLAWGAYIGGTAVQSWRGERALQATQLQFLSLADAQAESARSGRPVLADYSAIWCPSCRAMHIAFADPQLKALLASRYVLARVDADTLDAEPFRRRYGIAGFPALLVLDADGRLQKRIQTSGNSMQLASQL